jgi:hypothetical protein
MVKWCTNKDGQFELRSAPSGDLLAAVHRSAILDPAKRNKYAGRMFLDQVAERDLLEVFVVGAWVQRGDPAKGWKHLGLRRSQRKAKQLAEAEVRR